MKRAILIAILLIAIAAPSVFAAAPVGMTSWFGDDFDLGANTKLRLLTGWTGTGPENNNGTWTTTGSKSIRLKGQSGAGGASDAYNSTGFSASAAASSTTWLSVKLQSSLMAGQTGNHSKVSVRDSAGTELYRIWMNSGRAYFQALAGGAQEGGTFTFTDTTWHSFDMVYNSGTGALNAYVDGSLSWSAATSLTTGLTANTVYVYSYGWGPQDDVYMDEVWIGAGAGPPVVPEPSSLLAFGVFGISAFGFIRRRRA